MIRAALLALAILLVGCEGNPASAVEDIIPPPGTEIQLPGECYTPVGTHYAYDRVDSGTVCPYDYPATVRAVVRQKFYGKTCMESYWEAPEIRLIYGCDWYEHIAPPEPI